jgi:DeoR family transcriptional regulator, glycerol-3-phosphate regulon repressor
LEQTGEEGKKESRQASILRLVERNFYAGIEEIAARFSVTTQTARRDIMALEDAGKVRRLHGGAVLATPLDAVVYRQRRIDNAGRKERIGRLAADLVPDGAAIFIDSGTTCEAIARALTRRSHLRVVTYGLRVAAILSENTDFTVAVPGGFVRPVHGGIFQEDTADFIRRFKLDSAIISVSGIDSDGDICDDDHAEGAIATAAMAQAERTILAVDSSKFGRRAMVRLGSVAEVDMLISDTRPKGEILKLLEEKGVEIVC